MLNQLHARLSVVAETGTQVPGDLAVIGVHSAKFTAEKETENVRKAVRRYVINHPVVNDRDFIVWQQYACRAWPTLMFLDPLRKIIGKQEGEITFEQFDPLIAEMVEEFDGEGLIDRTPLAYRAEREADTPLAFPGKVFAMSHPAGFSYPIPITTASSSPRWREMSSR